MDIFRGSPCCAFELHDVLEADTLDVGVGHLKSSCTVLENMPDTSPQNDSAIRLSAHSANRKHRKVELPASVDSRLCSLRTSPRIISGTSAPANPESSAVEHISWHATELNTPVAGTKTGTAAIRNGPVKWGSTSIGTFVITCDSGRSEGEARAARDYAVILHERGGGVRVIAERVSLNAAAEECRAEMKRLEAS
jgi:hypothetical protein